jgi:ketosteroid isomerase-like protein
VAIAALYADDAVLLPPNRDMVRGRREIEKFWAAVIQRGWKDMLLTTMELSENGDTAYAIGTYTVKISRKGQEPAEDKGKYLLVWKHTAAGWKVHRDIWNSSTPRRK